MIGFGTQYYRPPFPETRFWRDDLARMRDAGLNTVQLWILWGWVEPEPGTFRFEDYDTLVNAADDVGLKVVLSTIAEIQPLWIHREVPGSEMVSTTGQKILSGRRNECHFGLTPGGCTDNPGVWERMACFLDTTAKRYRDLANLHGWDAWNELRWNVHAEALVCCCEHTLRAYRQWLDACFGGLDGLNKAWQMRYCSWEDIYPEKAPGGPYTLPMSFSQFIMWRACEHGQQRYAILKGCDPDHPVTLHGAQPSAYHMGNEVSTPLDRGNDWFYADTLDGVGTSSFPKWSDIDDADFGMRIEFVKSAARGKRVWLSELQGGRAATGFDVHVPVDARSQQRWVWNGLACGADTILFWCWRDEVFCRESGGFGLIGCDGLSEERLAAMKETGLALREHGELLEHYQPDRGEVGVLFSPLSYHHHWATEKNSLRAGYALLGYARALVRCSVPYTVVEDEHLEALEGLKLLFLPRVTAMSAAVEQALESFVSSGGTLVCESECGAYSPEGIYRYPEDRFIARLTGRREIGRRQAVPSIEVMLEDGPARLDVSQWLTPLTEGPGEVLAAGEEGALAVAVPVGAGRVLMVASYLGEEYYCRQRSHDAADRACTDGFERLVGHAVEWAGVRLPVKIADPRPDPERFLYVKSGSSGGRRMLFVFFAEGHSQARLRFAEGFFQRAELQDLLSGETVHVATHADGSQELVLASPAIGFAVLAE